MKKLLFVAAIFATALTVSCKKDDASGDNNGGNNNPPSSEVVPLTSINIPAAFSLAITSPAADIKVSLSPENASLLNDVTVTCEQPEVAVIEYSVNPGGIHIIPKSVGEAEFSLKPKSGPASIRTCKVTVTQKPAEPASVAILRTNSAFSDGQLYLVEVSSFQLAAEVTNDYGAVTSDFPVVWSVDKGAAYIDLNSETGEIVTKPLSGTTGAYAIVCVEVVDHPEISDQVIVNIQPVPTGISLSFSKFDLNPDGELIMKSGSTETITVTIQPAGAIGGIKVDCSNQYNLNAAVDGNKVKLTPNTRSSSRVARVTISALYNKAVSKSFDVYVFDYDKDDVKPGDYVYYSSIAGAFQTKDCGLRHYDDSGIVYQTSDGKRSTSPKAWPGDILGGPNAYTYIGVVVSASIPTENDFLHCEYLNDCKDGAKATGLYEYRTFTRSNLGGFYGASSTHALVVKKDQSDSSKWQESKEFVADSKDKQSGTNLYQSQLQSRYAFSQEACDYLNDWYSVNDCKYCPYGFLSYLLQKFYSEHVNNSS